MTWTKLSDDWTDRADLAALSFEDRWHYLAMIQLCSRGGRLDGVLRMVDARRCSDHPDPATAISRLITAGLVERVTGGVKVVEIEEHVPPPSVRNKSELEKIRKRRQRAHEGGDHSTCVAGRCAFLSVTSDVTRDIGRDIGRDPGTGRNGTDKELLLLNDSSNDSMHGSSTEAVDSRTGEVNDWPAKVPGRPDLPPRPRSQGVA